MTLMDRLRGKIRKRVAIVDDEPDLCHLLASALESQGYETRTAGDGEAGLELVRKFRPDVLLLDIKMPRMNGFEMLAEMRNDRIARDTKVIVLTSVDDEVTQSDEQWCDSLGCAAFVHKPYDPVRLLEIVAQVAGDSKAPAGS